MLVTARLGERYLLFGNRLSLNLPFSVSQTLFCFVIGYVRSSFVVVLFIGVSEVRVDRLFAAGAVLIVVMFGLSVERFDADSAEYLPATLNLDECCLAFD